MSESFLKGTLIVVSRWEDGGKHPNLSSCCRVWVGVREELLGLKV
jgi:hypothetical protein